MNTNLLRITKGASYYYYVRGLWTVQPPVDAIRAVAARTIGDFQEEIMAISQFGPLLIRQGHLEEAGKYVAEMRRLAQNMELYGDTIFTFFHAIGIYELARNRFEHARDCWQSIMAHMEELSTPFRVLTQHWFAKSLCLLGHASDAKQLLQAGLTDALRNGYLQGVITIQAYLATIHLDAMDYRAAEELLLRCKDLTSRYGDRTSIAEILRSYAQLEMRRGNPRSARGHLIEAIDILERMGMPRQLQKAREELRRLDELGEAPAA